MPDIVPSFANEGETARSERISVNAMRCPMWKGRMLRRRLERDIVFIEVSEKFLVIRG